MESEQKIEDFKGIYYSKKIKRQYYEGSAHFKYTDLYERLSIICNERKLLEIQVRTYIIIHIIKLKNYR